MRKTITMLSLMLALLFTTTMSFGQYSSSAIQKGSEQSLNVRTDSVPNQLQEIIVSAILENFDLTPKGIIDAAKTVIKVLEFQFNSYFIIIANTI